MGRPSIYTEELAAEICRRISDGESLRRISLEQRMPDKETVRTWLRTNPHFLARYRVARQESAHSIVEESLDRAREADDRDSAAAAKVFLDASRWAASKLNAPVYGDKLDLTGGFKHDHRHTGRIDLGRLSDAELEALDRVAEAFDSGAEGEGVQPG